MSSRRGWRAAAAAIAALLAMPSMAAEAPPSDAELFDLPFEDLLKVVVSASTRAQPLREAPATIHVITAAQIAERGYQTLEDALQDLPGIDLVHVGGAFPTIFAHAAPMVTRTDASCCWSTASSRTA